MNKFSNLKKLFNEIELLESAGLYKAANVLHKKFVKEAQQDPADLPSTDQANQPDDYIYNKSGQKAPILYMLENNQFTPEEEERLTSTGKGTDINGEEWTYVNKTKVQTPESSNTLGIGPSFPQVGNRQPKIGPTGLAQTPRTNIAPMSDPMLDQTDQDNNQVMDEDFLQKEIKRLADEFEDYIQNAILGRNVNNSLDTAKHNIDQVEKYVGPKYSQRIKDYANAQLDIMRKRYADMYQKYYVKDNVVQSPKSTSRGKLTDSDESAMYSTIVNQIKSLLQKRNLPSAEKLAKDYQYFFSNPKRSDIFQNQVNRIFSEFKQKSPFGPSVASQPEMSDAEGQTLTQLVNNNVQRNMQTSNNSQPSAQITSNPSNPALNNQLFTMINNFYGNRYSPTDISQMWNDLKSDSARANIIRYKIKALRNPALLDLFEQKLK
jgi:hypothetical protein